MPIVSCQNPFSQFSNGEQGQKGTVSVCDLSTCYQTISVWVQGLRNVFEREVGVYSGWMTLSLRGALPSCHTTKCHRTNLWVFFTDWVTLRPTTQKQVHIASFDGCPMPFIQRPEFPPLMLNEENVTPAVISGKHTPTDKELKAGWKGQAGILPFKIWPFTTIKISICNT